MSVDSEIDHEEVPARGYLTMAGIPAGLLLGLGSAYLLKRVGNNEEYLRDAPGTLLALAWLRNLGFLLAVISAAALLWSLGKKSNN